jgi:hypothetical protein
MRKTLRKRKMRKTRKRGGNLALPNNQALSLLPESSDNLLLTGGKRPKRK